MVISDAQFGFRKGRSTVDAIFVLNAVVSKCLNENKRLACAFIDFKKAFDSIYRNGLWLKLYTLGIRGKVLRIVKNLYAKVKVRVRCCSSYSEFFECSVGLKQGEVMSPLLFSLFLEDLEMFLLDDVNSGITIDDISFILMLFADDMVILGKNVEELQKNLDLLHDYCRTWGLEVNPDKSKIVVVRKRGPVRVTEKWLYGDKLLEVVDNFNYLGTVFN